MGCTPTPLRGWENLWGSFELDANIVVLKHIHGTLLAEKNRTLSLLANAADRSVRATFWLLTI
jgi:hypothetical protein